MSAKQAVLGLTGQDEDTGAQVQVVACVDFINTGCVYLTVDDGDSCTQVAIPDATARQLAEFILKETQCATSSPT